MQICVTHAHRILLVSILLLAGAPLLAAQTQTFDIASFTPPAGWTVAQGDDHIIFTFIDQAAGNYVMLAVYDSTPRSGDGEKDFASEWKNVVVKSFSQTATPRSVSNRTKSGLEFREGSANVSKNGANSYVRLMVFPAEKRMLSVMAVASNQGAFEGKQAAVRSFVDSMKISAQPAAAGRPAAGGGSSSSRNAGTIGGGGAPRSSSGIAGVWLGFKANYPSYEPRPRWYVYFEDGAVFEDLPRKGLAGFNREASKSDSGQRNYWGTYSVSGSSGTITKPGVRYPEKIEIEASSKMKLDGLVFNRCRSVDGLRLQGAWTSYANPNDPSLDRLPRGQAPVFHFTSDGKFVDDGVLAAFLHEGDGSSDSAGSGTYEIRDFTLILRYSDGRVKPLAFSGLCPGDAFTSNDLIFIGRSEFRKRK
jgi:hypothetical protein